MASELTVTAGLKFAKGTGDAAMSLSKSFSDVVDVSGTEYYENIQSVGTSNEALLASDVGTQGYVLLRNLDTTNFVTVSTDSSAHANPVVKLEAGEVAVFRANAALYLKADTGTCRVLCVVIED
jgi:hypothetical protein